MILDKFVDESTLEITNKDIEVQIHKGIEIIASLSAYCGVPSHITVGRMIFQGYMQLFSLCETTGHKPDIYLIWIAKNQMKNISEQKKENERKVSEEDADISIGGLFASESDSD